MRLLFSLLACFSLSLYADVHLLSLGEWGSVRYTYDQETLLEVERLSPSDEVIYKHAYHYDEAGRLIVESLIGDLGEIVYEGVNVIKSPYSLGVCEYDEWSNLIRHTQDEVQREYAYNELGQLIKDAVKESHTYDEFGNVVQTGDLRFSYDDENRLVEVASPGMVIEYEYDRFGTRVARKINGEVERYIYQGINEIAICDNEGRIKELRIPGLSTHPDILRPIAIEKGDTIYAPIHDVQGNIVKLVDIKSKEVTSLSGADPFGKGLSKDALTSWIFAGKHYDKEAGLVYFGERYYAPDLQQWLTRDPLQQSADLYQYCLDNPFAYFDPDGLWSVPFVNIAWGAGAVITAPIWGPYAAAAALGVAVGYYGYQAYEHWQEKVGVEPPYTWEDLGTDPTKCPGEGFEWRGTGTPGSGRGNWIRGRKGDKEELHPDFAHGEPIGPHWDYKGPNFPNGIRIKPDGTWENKPNKGNK